MKTPTATPSTAMPTLPPRPVPAFAIDPKNIVGVNPTVTADGFVTFVLKASEASTVGVRGSWGPSYDDVTTTFWPSPTPGEWTETIGPLSPGLYMYNFVIDGEPQRDPSNPNVVHSKPGSTTVLVPGPGAELLEKHADQPQGEVAIMSYHSAITDSERSATVWTPPGYSSAGGAYPTLYLMHGGGGDHLDWVQQGGAAQILDNLHNAGRITPMVVVMGDGNVPGTTGLPTEDSFVPELMEYLLPAVEERYTVSRSAAGRALAGLSLGGLQTFNTLLTHPAAFAYLGDMSSGYFPPVIERLEDEHAELLAKVAKDENTRLLRVYIGNRVDIAYGNNIATRALFDRHGIAYSFAGVFDESSHNMHTWQHDLIDFLPRIFA